MNETNFMRHFLSFIILFVAPGLLVSGERVQHKSAAWRTTVTDPLQVVDNYLSDRSSAKANADTLRVLALRVQFVRDSLKTTTGDGHFNLSDTSEYSIDRPPHNKTYFEHQLLALHNYFSTISNGQLTIESNVLPAGETDAYQMPHNMVYYSGEENEERQTQRWAELLRDAVTAAQADNPTFSDYDAFIVFHAGVGNDFAFDFNETPFNIQSAFIDFQTLKETLGADDSNFQGIAAGNDFFIQEGIILPEQQSQKGIDLGLLGTATLLMGSQLGMPSLFNTDTGRAGIGMWGLMDQGSYNYYGLIPAYPCAWMKVYMGWEEPVVVHTLEEAMLGSANTTAPHLYKIPINSQEYFLLENRQEDWNGDGITYGRDADGTRVKFDSLGTIVAEAGLGVITHIDEYDYGLPGSGVLIWHINDRVIEANLATNTINNDPDNRGVDLVECDGPQDIGQVYQQFTPGYGTEAGDYWDPYWSGNISHQYVNGEKPVEFSSTSIPPSYGYNRSKTHIRIANFSDKDTVMTFTIDSDLYRPGFPQYTGVPFFDGALNTLKLADDSDAIVAVSQDGHVYAWKTNGDKVIANDLQENIVDAAGQTKTFDVARVAMLENSVSQPPVTADIDPTRDGEELLVVEDWGLVSVFSLDDADSDGNADLLYSFDLKQQPTAGPMYVTSRLTGNVLSNTVLIGTAAGHVFFLGFRDNEFSQLEELDVHDDAITGMLAWGGGADYVFATASGAIITYANSGSLSRAHEFRAFGNGDAYYVVRGLRQQQIEQVMIVSNDGMITLLNGDATAVSETHKSFEYDRVSVPALGDVDADGRSELLFDNLLHLAAFEMSGNTTLNFPITLAQQGESKKSVSPVWVKGENQSLTLTPSNEFIYGMGADGSILDDYPIAAGGPVSSTLLLQNSSKVTLYALSDDGFLYGWKVPVATTDFVSWYRYGGDQYNSFYFDLPLIDIVKQGDVLPRKKVFCYPNPSYDGKTFIRYSLNDYVDDVTIRIYDVAGELVTEFDGNNVSPGDHEVLWDASNIQSGAYIARVEAQADSENRVEFIKIAVVK